VKIDRALVRDVARLAALDLEEGEDALFAEDLTRIVEHFEALRSVPDGLLPPLPAAPPMALREDGPALEPAPRPWVTANSPETLRGHFVVPRVVSRNG
jgi:aspartyl/glutamyl-tRNA(Asn/Gln) amidotransferase C subunit